MRESPTRVAGIRTRNALVLEEIARECLPKLARAARAAGLDPAHAEDAVQETFLVFLRRAPEFDGRARASTWLFGILFHKLRESHRALMMEANTDDIEEVMEARFRTDGRWARPTKGPLGELAGKEVRSALGDCLEGVPERQRAAFHLRDVEGFTTEEVCKLLEVSPNNLGVLLFRGRNRLRECLETKGFEGSADADLS